MTTAARAKSAPWLQTAPPELVQLHGRSGGDRRAVLGRLLQDLRMARTWRQVERQQQKVGMDPFSLWGAIQTALSGANREEARRKTGKLSLRKEAQKHASKAARIASNLAGHLRKDGPLDFLAHELFPDDVARLAWIGIPDRNLNKAGMSLANTTFVELLIEYQRRAEKSVQTQPIVQRVRQRKEASNKDIRPLLFVRVLHNIFFKHRFGGQSHAVMAAIANVTLELPPHLELTGDAVRRALRENPTIRASKKASV